jgi:hypothetical protein
VLIVPSDFAEHPKASPGERDIFSRLKTAEKGKDWIVLHSLELLAHTKKSQSEADFVFLVPGKGVLVLELKAAKTITHGVDGWKIGEKTEKRGPFVQAKEAMFSIMEYLEPLKVELGDVPFVYAVWLTHISRATVESSISWKDEQVLTSEDLKRDITEVISETIDRLVSDLKIYKPSVLAPAKKGTTAKIARPGHACVRRRTSGQPHRCACRHKRASAGKAQRPAHTAGAWRDEGGGAAR